MNDVRNELKMTGPISLGQPEVRCLAGINSGRISLNDLKGKKSPWFKNIVDYYFETRDDFDKRIQQILAENNQNLEAKTFGFGDGVTELVGGFKNISIPKAIYSNNIQDLTNCFYAADARSISPELLYNCSNIKNLTYAFAYSMANTIPEGLLIKNTKIENIEAAFSSMSFKNVPFNLFDSFRLNLKKCSNCFANGLYIETSLPDVWNKEKFPNVTSHSGYAFYCEKAENYKEIPEGYK